MVRTKQASKRPILGSRFAPSIKPARKSAPTEIPSSFERLTQNNAETSQIVPKKRVSLIGTPKGVRRTLRKPIETKRFIVNSIPRRVFQNLCKDISYRFIPDCRFTKQALGALQMAVEDYMVGFMEDAAAAMRHAGRRTLMQKDFELIKKLRKMDYNDKF